MIDEILKHKIISFVGSGGKTTLMFAIAKKLSELGKKVIVTTSTKIYIPKNYIVVLPCKNDLEATTKNNAQNLPLKIRNCLDDYNICVTGSLCSKFSPYEGQKICSYEYCGLNIDDFANMADFVLIEADGSKHMPLKFPQQNEPVIPKESDMIIAVAAMWCTGHPIYKVCHRYELACKFLSKQYGYDIGKDHIVTSQDIIKIMNSDLGYKKNVGNRVFWKYLFYNENDYEGFEI